ncbi:hypothetical protein Nepgr_002432 [Nepenthes gracilis]|uniref:Uncharacterized protein n=1 Tax=Nepenthes gracilis TaxID=150966 RepID=A0AAD3P8T2_NEPGR|nr:hypothetical protein Nepgr_002432 [Nepenthes gracilis]
MMKCTGWRCLLFLLPVIFLLPHIFSVLELHHSSAIKDPLKKRAQKLDHLVFGPAAGVALQNRMQCQGTKALNKTRHSSLFHASHPGGSIAFVSVFTVYNASINRRLKRPDSDSVTVGNVSYTKSERSMAILDVFARFIQLTMPRSHLFILTDPASDLHIDRKWITVYPIQGQYSREELMLQRIRSYIAFLDSRLKELSKKKEIGQIDHYIFTDTDIAVVDDLSQIFYEYPDFHLALTFRNNKEQPLNSGFVAVRGTLDGIQRAKVFLMEVLKAYSTRYMKASRMLGDQLALAWVVKSHLSFDLRRFAKPVAFVEKINGTSILFLPCANYNWTPPEGAGQFHGMPLDVKVIHFKGSRKRLMLEAWNYFNSSSNMDDMLCLILASGRAKYDF